MSKTLSEIREEIDTIDNNVHDLLMRRASLVSSVAEAKKKDGAQIVQPAREARMVRRLLARHEGSLPERTIIRIWRELVGSVALLQSGFTVHVIDNDLGTTYWDLAKEYFGSIVPMGKVQGVNNVIGMVQNKSHESFGVLPWPEVEEDNPWWVNLCQQNDEEKISIILSLPNYKEQEFGERAVVISKVNFLPSDEDISFIALVVDQDMSRGAVRTLFENAGFDVLRSYHASGTQAQGRSYFLFEVDGFVEIDSPLLEGLRESVGDKCVYCDVIGGYPVVPDIS